ncbi:CVNH domain-containing protein [Colletotrichum graminicola]|uniref:CVNH domain-containing protein n=1 Tax=Colletotrichum graminicola (strain M1.001 / M2 / FGSC 10212) TaxID=645133 RepID=E3QUH6_COLGM|nr:CVNH domain-containing protein [Colletotrichum graminicola M1.001]EFQ34514.1 CVNH domain-containing protein [Colletotrichum graminicola M1.001]WDK22593.1 CVNH domain-containing protein [Colletotrichum graminicola]
MSFHISAQDIRVDDGHILRARLNNENGECVDAECNLNDFLGNNNGSFEWGGSNFSQSAEDIHFSIEGGDSVPILRARLFNVEGEAVDCNVNLSERIGNDNGCFCFNC